MDTVYKISTTQLQRQINIASEWFKKWRLRINEAKTVAILFGRTQKLNIKLEINNNHITWSNNVEYLGITINYRLNFSNHAETIVKKATKIRGSLYPVLNKKCPIPARTRLNLFKMYIQQILTYAGASWAPFICKSSWKKIEAVQTIGIRTTLVHSTKLGSPKHSWF